MQLVISSHEFQASENLGMAMVYTLFSTAKEWLAERFAQDDNDGVAEAEERAKDEVCNLYP